MRLFLLLIIRIHLWKKLLKGFTLKLTEPIRTGANILILSDRGVDENHVAIPSLLAVAAMQQHLVTTKKRTSVWQ